MELKDFNELVNYKLITDVTYYDYYKKNESELAKLSLEEIAQRGFVAQPAANAELVKGGVDVLPNMTVAEFVNLLNEGGEIKLINDIYTEEMFTVSSDVVIDLNGFEIKKSNTTESGKCVLFYVKGDGAKMTIKGNGKVTVDSGMTDIAIWSDKGAVVNIEGGDYHGVGQASGADLIYAMNGKINVSGGTFKLDNMSETSFAQPQYSLLNAYGANVNTAKDYIEVTGGRFYGFDPMNNVSEGIGTNFVVDGYESVEVEPGVFEVRKVEIVVDEQ